MMWLLIAKNSTDPDECCVKNIVVFVVGHEYGRGNFGADIIASDIAGNA